MQKRASLFNRWTVIAGIVISVLMCLAAWAVIQAIQPRQTAQSRPTAELLIIPAPSLTPTPPPNQPTPTPTLSPAVDGIAVGMYVQISGTEGEGLRLRSGPGISQGARFIGMDAEVFKVEDGPKRADDYTWWYLVAPYDETRSGWAASAYLVVVQQP